MTDRPALPPAPYLVVGLARSGVSVARVLKSHGEVIGCDSSSPPQARELEGIEVHLADDGTRLVERARTVVKSPGVPGSAAAIQAARKRGIEVVGELEIAWRLLENQFVAVTGTNGKTTTCELLGAMHREAGVGVAVCGNVGRPVSDLVGAIDKDTVIVCEASSFQLEDSPRFSPECGLILNLAEDHLDRHGSFEAYRAAKLSMFSHQSSGDVAVGPEGLDFPGKARRVTFGKSRADLLYRDGGLWWHDSHIVDCARIRLRGGHNVENAMAAAATAMSRGLDREAVTQALQRFEGVSHRLEEVATCGGVLFVNDSKATNVASAKVGIEAFAGGVHLICGGSLKGESFAALRAPVAERCIACYLIGEASNQLERELDGAGELVLCEDLDTAVKRAASRARAGEVVLLSPACASYDQYRNFEERGDHFRRLVAEA